MYKELAKINKRPKPFACYTAANLWTDKHISKKMLEYHLHERLDICSRNIEFINKSSDWIIKHFKLNSKSEIIDFGCGPGLYTIRFARKGIKVTGIDFSKRSIEYAKRMAANEKLNIDYLCDNYLEFDSIKKYDLVTMIMCDFCVLSPRQRKNLLSTFKKILLPDGFVLLDVYSLNSFSKRYEIATYEFNPQNNFWSPNDYYCFLNTFKYEKEKVILDKYAIIEKSSIRTIYNWFQYYSIDSLKKEFEENGLKILEVYSDVAGLKYKKDSLEFTVVAAIN